MYKINKEEIIKYLLQNFSDEGMIKQIEILINEAVKDLKVEIVNNQVSPDDAKQITEYVLKHYQKIEISQQAKTKTSFIALALACCLGVGGTYYYLDSNRYSIEQEYALLSACIGESAPTNRKKECIAKLKQCQSDKKDIKDCKMQSLLLNHF